jgi:conserved protein with predicted RNA binding PUA domain
MVKNALSDDLNRIRAVADYQFGKDTGKALFPKDVEIQYSPRTGRIRFINHGGERLATLRPTDGLLSLSIKSAQTMAMQKPHPKCFVTLQNSVAEYIKKGGDVFAVHVVKVDEEIRAKDEVVVVDEDGKVLAVGRAVLSSEEMRSFKSGVAVKVRHGIEES